VFASILASLLFFVIWIINYANKQRQELEMIKQKYVYSITNNSGTFYTNEYDVNGSCIEFYNQEDTTTKITICGQYTIHEKKTLP
jgi:competence CoiA-like predicted nuclease